MFTSPVQLVVVLLLTMAYLHAMDTVMTNATGANDVHRDSEKTDRNPTIMDALKRVKKEPTPVPVIHTREKRLSDEYLFRCGLYRCDSRKQWCDTVTQDCVSCGVYCQNARLQALFRKRCEHECRIYTELLGNRTDQLISSRGENDKGIDNDKDKGIDNNNNKSIIKESQTEMVANSKETALTAFQQSVIAITVLAIVLTIILIITICVFGLLRLGCSNSVNRQTQTVWSREMENSARDEDFDTSMIALRPKPEGSLGVFLSNLIN